MVSTMIKIPPQSECDLTDLYIPLDSSLNIKGDIYKLI